MVDVLINDGSDKGEETCKMFWWKTINNYSEHKELFSVDNVPINEAHSIYSIFIFRHVTGQNIDHLSNRVQLLEAIFNEYANDRSEVSHLASNNMLPRLKDRCFIRKNHSKL